MSEEIFEKLHSSTLAEIEQYFINERFKRLCDANNKEIAESLGIGVRTLYTKIQKPTETKE